MNDSKQSNPIKELKIKGGEKILNIIKKFSATEKVVFSLFVLIAGISALSMVFKINNNFLIPIPAHGGSLIEGVIGLPRSINPVLAFTDVDRDLTTLIYSGLMKYEKGKIINDLAKNYTISDDGLIYSFTLKDNIRFHDGMPLTTDDIEFTIQKIQDNSLKSPKRADWANVTVKKINSNQIQFILKQPYSPFLSNLTIGILPKHIWKDFDSEQFIFNQNNTEPIGSGPYKINNIKKDNNIPLQYNLVSFNKYYNSEAYISSININFYSNEKEAVKAYNSGLIESLAGLSPIEISQIASTTKDIKILSTPLPRIFAIFFNQNSAQVLANEEVRQALNLAIDKNKIINQVLFGYGITVNSPLRINTKENNSLSSSTAATNREMAKEILKKAGWTINSNGILEKKDKKTSQTLSFSITTSDTPDLKQIAEMVKSEWEELGAEISIKVFEYGDLSQNIIKTRKYDALLFGEFIGKDLDLFAFWHSSQRNSPGLNISMFVNSKADKILEDIRTINDDKVKKEKYADFEKIIQNEMPAVFLYSPKYSYIIPNKIKDINFEFISNPSDRLYGIEKWYISTDNVWKVFAKDKINK